MTIPSVTVKATNIQSEFGGSNPISLSEYYAGGAYVPNPAPTSGSQSGPVPTSGTIRYSMFRGLSKAFVFNDVVSSNLTSGYSLTNRAVSAGWNGVDILIANITVNSGVYISGTSTSGVSAMYFNGLPAGSSVTLTNYGYIIGRGGNGGNGASITSTSSIANATPGTAGQYGLLTDAPTVISNYGVIAGGGGGGGGGGAAISSYVGSDGEGNSYTVFYESGGGGGGGGGRGVTNTGGAGGSVAGDPSFVSGDPGGPGTLTGPGGLGGGSRSKTGQTHGGSNGGTGGNWGQPGWPGVNGVVDVAGPVQVVSLGAVEGAGGGAILNGSNITWNYYGSLQGNVDSYGTYNGPGFANMSYVNAYTKQTLATYGIYSAWSTGMGSPWYWMTRSAQNDAPIATYDIRAIVIMSEATSVRLVGCVDNGILGNAVYVNGTSYALGTSFSYTPVFTSNPFTLPAGLSVIGLQVQNISSPAPNPAGFALEVRHASNASVYVPTNGWRML